MLLNLLFAGVDQRFFQRVSFIVSWTSQGSGLHFSDADLLDMPLPRLIDYKDRVNRQHQKEGKAARNASAGAKTGRRK